MTQQKDSAGVDFIIERMNASQEIVMAKLTTMTKAEMNRERKLTRAWLAAANDEYNFGGSTRAGRIMDRAGDSGKTMTELTNGVMPDGTQI